MSVKKAKATKPETIPALFGVRLAHARKLRGYERRNRFARELGEPSGTVTAWELDPSRQPRGEVVQRCANLLGVSAAWLVGTTDEMLEGMTMPTGEHADPEALAVAWAAMQSVIAGKAADLVVFTVPDNSLAPDFCRGDRVLIDKAARQANGFWLIDTATGQVLRKLAWSIAGDLTVADINGTETLPAKAAQKLRIVGRAVSRICVV